jgi:putative membrane-bound dehydrogenase-like protein
MKRYFFLIFSLFLGSYLTCKVSFGLPIQSQDSTKIDVEYHLEASMLGYFGKDGTRNPILKANKGNRVRITITNTEVMTHDISLEKLGLKSKTILEKGSSTNITFIAQNNDTYFCTIPGHRAAGMVGQFQIVNGPLFTKAIVGKIPTKNHKVLNFGFETGNLTDWKAQKTNKTSGEFEIINTEPSPFHEKEMKIGFEGRYFISSGGTKNHQFTGVLQSNTFKVSHPWASFLVSGGALVDTRVELVLTQSQKVIFKSTGQGRANLQPVVADLRKYLGKEIFIKIVDNETGISQIPYISNDKWAHINFDDFRFYAKRPQFANELFQKDIIVLPPLDPVINAGLSGAEAAKAMTLPKGFKINLAAAEPEVVRPISFTIDWKGRLWVVEGHTYPTPAPEGQGRDRILIFEDTNGDGSLDSRKIFMENLNMVAGIELGMGGVWLAAAPYLLFVPADFETDKPTGPPQKLLDGWGLEDTHEILNNLRWGPDGWLYGVHGVFTHSNVGKPGTPDHERTKINAGVWRFHPTKHQFEVFAEGTSNPWGIDFDDFGQPFITACVIPHMYHIIQGARYERQAGKSFNPFTFDEIKTIADHRHYVGERGPHAGNFRSASAGGGHAHAGAMIYLGGENWPAEYRNTIFMNNINGAKLNNDQLVKSGSGYIGRHRKDFLSMNDTWSQWLNLKYDQNGSVYAIDWYDKNQCHSKNPDVHDNTMGRIFKISHEKDTFKKIDLRQKSVLELVEYHLSSNEYFVRQARTLLQEKGKNPIAEAALKDILVKNPDITRKLRALWTLQVINGVSETELIELLSHSDENIRAWAIQFLCENKTVSAKALEKFESLSKTDQSAMVHLYLLSGMQRLSLEKRWAVLENLSQNEAHKVDHNIPLMLWYGAEPLAELDAKRALKLAEKSKMPDLLHFMVRRVGALNTEQSRHLLKELKSNLGQNHEAHSTIMEIDKALGASH